MAFLKATNQIETFRAWQLQNTREQEHDYSEDEHGTSVSESVSSEHAKESVSDEGSIDHDVADILTTEDEENDEGSYPLNMQSNYPHPLQCFKT